MKLIPIKKYLNRGIQTHMADWPHGANIDFDMIAEVKCEAKRCIYDDRLLDLYECLACDHLSEETLSDKIIDTYLRHLEADEDCLGVWPKLEKTVQRLKEIKLVRKSTEQDDR